MQRNIMPLTTILEPRLHSLIGLCQPVPTASLQVHLLSDAEYQRSLSAVMLVCLSGVASAS